MSTKVILKCIYIQRKRTSSQSFQRQSITECNNKMFKIAIIKSKNREFPYYENKKNFYIGSMLAKHWHTLIEMGKLSQQGME